MRNNILYDVALAYRIKKKMLDIEKEGVRFMRYPFVIRSEEVFASS